jgi:hypothetical protein
MLRSESICSRVLALATVKPDGPTVVCARPNRSGYCEASLKVP